MNAWVFRLCVTCVSLLTVNSVRVAIVGAGIGGGSTASFLKQLMGDAVEVDVFESERQAGGRLALVEMGTRSYEAGGSIIHDKNMHMGQFMQLFDLKKRKDDSTDVLGLFDGSSLVFEGSRWSVVNYMRLALRYGMDLLRAKWSTDDMLDKFENIYTLHKKGYAFTTPELLLKSMHPSFPPLLHSTLEHYLRTQKKIRERFTSELANAAMLCNYGQSVYAPHAFVGSVSLAGADGNLFAIRGGNRLVPEMLVNSSANAFHTGCAVKTVRKSADKFTLVCGDGRSFGEYDDVVLAAPQIKGRDESNVKFENVDMKTPIEKYHLPYHRTVATFIQGDLASEAFGAKTLHGLTSILVTNESLYFMSVGQQGAVEPSKEKAPAIYKVFSPAPLTNDEVNRLFSSVHARKEKDWLAYPQYSALPSELPPFELADGLYYVNGIEWLASAMEMSSIGGNNVALLIANKHRKRTELIDAEIKFRDDRVEL